MAYIGSSGPYYFIRYNQLYYNTTISKSLKVKPTLREIIQHYVPAVYPLWSQFVPLPCPTLQHNLSTDTTDIICPVKHKRKSIISTKLPFPALLLRFGDSGLSLSSINSVSLVKYLRIFTAQVYRIAANKNQRNNWKALPWMNTSHECVVVLTGII